VRVFKIRKKILVIFLLVNLLNLMTINSICLAYIDNDQSDHINQEKILGCTLNEVGKWDNHYGNTGDIFAVGNLVYCANSEAGLVIINVLDPANPVYVGEYMDKGGLNGGIGRGVFVEGNYAFLADDDDGLEIIDISNPASPVEVGQCDDSEGQCFSVIVEGDYAFVADGYEGLEIIDVSSKSSPTEVAQVHSSLIGFAVDVAISGNYAHLACDERYSIVDISDPLNPTKVISVSLPSSDPRGVAVKGDIVYLTDGWGDSIRIFNITNIASPVEAPQVICGNSNGLFIDDDILYVSITNLGVKLYNISDQDDPQYITQYGIIDSRVPFVSNGLLFTNDLRDSLHIVNVTTPQTPILLGQFHNGGWAKGVDVSVNYAFVADYYYGLAIIDITDKTNPTEIGRFYDGGYAYDVVVRGDYAFVADYYDLKIIDISTPSSPTKVGQYTMGSGGYVDVQIIGDYAFCANVFDNLVIIDISDETSPSLVANYDDAPGQPFGLFVSGDYVYMANRIGEFSIVDISTITAPTTVATIPAIDLAMEVFVKDDIAYIADQNKGFFVVNVTDPTNPSIIKNVDDTFYPLSQDIWSIDNITIVTHYREGLQVYKTEDFQNITKLTSFYDGGFHEGLCVYDGCIYLAGGSDGLEILNYTIESSKPTSSFSIDIEIWFILDIVFVCMITMVVYKNRRKR